MQPLRLLRTLSYLRPGQVLGRVRFRLYHPHPGQAHLPALALPAGPWRDPARREPSSLGADRVRFLAVEGTVWGAAAWNDPARDKLWLYNLHYFDDLNARDGGRRLDWQRGLIARWVAENPPFSGNGWEPYPTSLRLVNWLKWALAGNRLEPAWAQSLALQARWLRRRLEWHLLGNHLFVNAKALVFAGLCFRGAEADEWLRRGLGILARELPEQVLPDGGQFERSPLYHALALEDLLDLLNLATAVLAGSGPQGRGLDAPLAASLTEAVAAWRRAVGAMRVWLAALCHPDGEIALFNDAALGIAPTPGELDAYARRLGLGAVEPTGQGLTRLDPSGYLRLALGPAVALLDCAPIGPDYLPGHAHADTLSFELSLWARRLVVDTGTDRYGEGAERLRQRGTAAHNTVEIDGTDSSEVWGGFRVARRARPFGLRVAVGAGSLAVECAHDGYRRLPGRPVHRRCWTLTPGGLRIRDEVLGRCRTAVARLHLHPEVRVELDPEGAAGVLWLGGREIRLQTAGATRVRLVPSSYHPQFGVCQRAQCLDLTLGGSVLETHLTWVDDQGPGP